MRCIACAADGVLKQEDAIPQIHRPQHGCEYADIRFPTGYDKRADPLAYEFSVQATVRPGEKVVFRNSSAGGT